MAGLRLTLCVALLASIAAIASAGSVPALSAACLADRTQGCCPGHIKLLQLELDGCDVADVLSAASDTEAAAACSQCSAEFNAVALTYGQASGESCAIVQQAVSMFPFACKTAGAAPCIGVVQRLVAQLGDAASISQTDLAIACETGGCWSEYMLHMRRSNYDINGAEQSDYVDRIGGNNALFMCLNVDNQFCLPQLPGFEQLMPTAPGVLDDIDLTQDTSDFCSGCGRVLLSNRLALLADDTFTDEHREGVRRYLLGLCPGGCTAEYVNGMPGGRRAFLDTEWKACEALYTNRNNPVCSTAATSNCLAFVSDVNAAFGCCSRFALESAALGISARTGHELPGQGAWDIPWFVEAAAQTGVSSCNVDLQANCDVDHTTTATIQPKDTFTASGDLGGVDVTLFDEDSEVLKRDEFYYKFRQDISSAIGALPESITINSVNAADGTIHWTLKERTVAATLEAGQAYTSLVNAGGVLLPSVGAFYKADTTLAGAGVACPTELIPNYAYIPGVGTVTTDCDTLKTVREATNGAYVDCSVPDSTDAYGNDLWLVSDTLLSNAMPC